MQIPWNLSYSFCEAPSMGSGAEECVLLTTELSRHPPPLLVLSTYGLGDTKGG